MADGEPPAGAPAEPPGRRPWDRIRRRRRSTLSELRDRDARPGIALERGVPYGGDRIAQRLHWIGGGLLVLYFWIQMFAVDDLAAISQLAWTVPIYATCYYGVNGLLWVAPMLVGVALAGVEAIGFPVAEAPAATGLLRMVFQVLVNVAAWRMEARKHYRQGWIRRLVRERRLRRLHRRRQQAGAGPDGSGP